MNCSSPDPLTSISDQFRRPYCYGKMESLIKEMQDEETGVPVRSQKVFLSSIPAAFAGYDVIEWLMERLNIEDSVEAIHLANLLCHHGYFFPVGNNQQNQQAFNVKDDSGLYRFQTPYYWPNRTPSTQTTTDYAIYLSKRSQRSKQKHALEEYELESLNDLKRGLGVKWDFVVMQAEEQVRLSKDRKKSDKLVMDSQERAYWRVLRPPPGFPHCVESPPYYSTHQQPPPRKTNHLLLEDLTSQVTLLKTSCTRTRIKTSHALETLSAHCDSYYDHDAFLIKLINNPWTTDDVAFWQLEKEQLSERRVKRWGVTLEDLIFDPLGLREFTTYLKKEYCHENIRFWLAVRGMKYGPVSMVRRRCGEIYGEFLSPGSPCEINIDCRTMDMVQKELNFNPSRFTFDPAADHVYLMLLKKDCYPRFIRSEHYKQLLERSGVVKGVANKRLDKFFSFVAERKKKPTIETKPTELEVGTSMGGTSKECPYRGDIVSQQNSMDDACCPWEETGKKGEEEGVVAVGDGVKTEVDAGVPVVVPVVVPVPVVVLEEPEVKLPEPEPKSPPPVLVEIPAPVPASVLPPPPPPIAVPPPSPSAICPWDHENGATSTFTKNYTTLGYL